MKKITKVILSVAAAVSLGATALMAGCADGRDGKDGVSLDWYAIYQAVNEEREANGEQPLTYGEFVQYYLSESVTPESSKQIAINHSMLSSVSVFSTFAYTTTFSNGFSSQTVNYNKVGAGAGVIIDLDKDNGNAYIVTNCHVVYEYSASPKFCNNVKLFLYGQDTVGTNLNLTGYYVSGTNRQIATYEITDDEDYCIEAEVIGASMTYDIAVLKVTGSEVLKRSSAVAATWASDGDLASVKAGNECYLVGNPSGYGTSVTSGIISVDSEYITLDLNNTSNTSDDVEYRVMRTDAAINGGNSGGGCYNANGDLIGIVNAKNIADETDNMGYALPGSNVKRVVQSLIDNASYTTRLNSFGIYKAETGIVTTAQTYADANAVKHEVVRVESFATGSRWSGVLQQGDVIERIEVGTLATSTTGTIFSSELSGFTVKDGADVTRSFVLDDLTLSVRAGDTVKLTVTRNGSTMYAYVTYSTIASLSKSS